MLPLNVVTSLIFISSGSYLQATYFNYDVDIIGTTAFMLVKPDCIYWIIFTDSVCTNVFKYTHDGKDSKVTECSEFDHENAKDLIKVGEFYARTGFVAGISGNQIRPFINLVFKYLRDPFLRYDNDEAI